MSTRAQIGFYPSEHDPIDTRGTVYIYQHSDGSPEGVLPVLEPFARSFHKRRGLKDTDYATARCIVALAQVQEAERARAQEAGIPSRALEQVEYLGLGAGTVLYPTLSYFYHVSPTRIGVYRVSLKGSNPPAFHLQHTIALAPPRHPQGQPVSVEAQ